MANLKHFFETIDKVKPEGRPEMGLVVKKPAQSLEEIVSALPHQNFETFKLNKEVFSDDFLKKIIEVFEKKNWLVVELEDEFIDNRIYSQLRLLCTMNRLQIFNLTGSDKEEINLLQPKESRLIFVTTKEILAKLAERGFNRFVNLFGPVMYLQGEKNG